MISRTTSFGVGLMLSALLAYGALSGESVTNGDCTPTPRMSEDQSRAIKWTMCVEWLQAGGVGYGEGRVNSCMKLNELDHIMPLCLGGSNDRSNLQLEPWAEAREKDIGEHDACRDVRAGKLSCKAARALFMKE